LFTNYQLIIVPLKQVPAAHQVHLPAGRRVSTQRATLRSAQSWLWASCPDFITKDQWLPNSPNINPMDYHVYGVMLEA